MPRVHLVRVSRNVKTGPIPTSTSEESTCPPSCALKDGGCYAKYGPSRIHWKKVSDGRLGMDWGAFVEEISRLPQKQLWRHNVAGDLPTTKAGDGTTIDVRKLNQLVKANKGKRGFTYTHHDVEKNLTRILKANSEGFTINISANNPQQAADYHKTGAPVVSVVPLNFWEGEKNRRKIAGVDFIRCPAEYQDGVSCATCAACAIPTRKSVIGFTAHGTGKNRVNIIASDF